MWLFDAGLFAAAQMRGKFLDHHSAFPRRAQEQALRALTWRARATAFGREHGFASLRGPEEFRERVPLRDYAALKPWLVRALAGEHDVIWPGKIPYFGMSSGTTAGNKYLPISMASVAQQRRGGFEPIAAYLRAGGQRDVMSGAAILLGSTTELERRASGVFVGDNTGIMARHIPAFVRHKQLPTPETRRMQNWDDKLVAIAREAIDRDVRVIAGTPAWFTGLFDAVLALARERGLPARTVTELWPRLRLLTGGGVRYAPYRPRIEARLGAHVPYFDVYNATEGGIMGVQDRMHDPAMRLLPDARVYYEFVPLSELQAAAPRRLSMWEVEVGEVYALAVSTPSGLFAYLLGDCLRFVSTFPHRFVFEGRTKAFLNVCGEHVSQAELERAVAAACVGQGVVLTDFTVLAQVSERGVASHTYLVEQDGRDGQLPDAEKMAAAIDVEVGRDNEDYRTHRSSALSLAAPRVVLLPRGAFERYMRARGKLGGQHKVPRVIEDRALLRELLAAVPENPSRSDTTPVRWR
jgi:hypothetical protein